MLAFQNFNHQKDYQQIIFPDQSLVGLFHHHFTSEKINLWFKYNFWTDGLIFLSVTFRDFSNRKLPGPWEPQAARSLRQHFSHHASQLVWGSFPEKLSLVGAKYVHCYCGWTTLSYCKTDTFYSNVLSEPLKLFPGVHPTRVKCTWNIFIPVMECCRPLSGWISVASLSLKTWHLSKFTHCWWVSL